MSIYKPCDIRGDAATELTPELYRRWGFALGARLVPGLPFLVGGDVRESTPQFLESLIEGLVSAGMVVGNLGIVPTPMVYFAKRVSGAPACAIVTASHNPPGMNGLKWVVDGHPSTEEEVKTLERAVRDGRRDDDRQGTGSRGPMDIAPQYHEWLADFWRRRDGFSLSRVVVDPGNGCWAGRAVVCLKGVFPQAVFSAINDVPDGRFPNRTPDCAPQHLVPLAEAVCAAKADLGIAFDGDGDRVAFVDNEGTPLTAEETTWLLLNSFGDALKGRVFVQDVKFSDRIADTARRFGGHALPTRSGHAFVRARMIESRALFGAEVSGHYFHGALDGGDDGLFTACRLIAHLADSRRPLAGLRRECPVSHMTPEFRLAIDGDPFAFIADVARAFRDHPLNFIDGVRVDFPEGWALVRPSVTESMLTFRFEGCDGEGLRRVVRVFCDRLPRFGAELRRLCEAAT